MSAPRHLWSGDWQLESAAIAEELARRRAQIGEPEATQPEPPAAPSGPSRLARAVAWLREARRRRRRQLRVALLVALLALVGAGAAWGVTSLLAGSGGQGATAAGKADQQFGIAVAGSPLGVVVTHVVPGSAAAASGLQPGDLLTQIDGQPIGTVDSVGAALSGLRGGSQITIQFTSGPASFTTTTTLGPRLPGFP
jgi:hypothetical protein